jgi:hypothetical protein
MPVTEDFKASMADLLVRKQTKDVAIRGRPPDDNVGTHIKQPLARPKMDKSDVDQTRLALDAVASLKARKEKNEAVYAKKQISKNDRSSNHEKGSDGAPLVKPSEVDEPTGCVTC